MKNLLAGKKVILAIASSGYQPLEYEVPKKILESHRIHVITASDRPGGAVSKDDSIMASVDITMDKIVIENYDGIFFIGGPGALTALDNGTSYHILSRAKKLDIPFGAICISTRILAKAEVLKGIKATGWNGDAALPSLLQGHGAIYTNKPVVLDGHIVTAEGPKAAEEFGNTILQVLTEKALE